MPAAVGGQVCGTAEDFVALGAPVLHAHYARALVLREGERVGVLLFTKLADELSQRLVPGGSRRLLPLSPQLGTLLLYPQTQNRRSRDLILEVEFAVHFGFLGRVARGLFVVSIAVQALVRFKERAFSRCVMLLLVHKCQWREQVHMAHVSVVFVTVPVGRRVAAAAREEPLKRSGN